MVSTFTPNIQIEEPARGDQVGAWDTPVNINMTLLDLCVGGTATISLNNSNVLLGNAQFQAARITFNSTLTGNVTITFPTSFKKRYDILNLCTGSSAFTITLATTAAGGQVIGCPPGQSFEAWNDGTNLVYHNFGPPIGGYWDYAGSSNPAWNTLCTVDPYLPCDGSAVSSATYPVLFGMTGATTPDFRGRGPVYNNQGTGRVTSSNSGVNGDVNFSAGGSELLQAHGHGITDPGHTHVGVQSLTEPVEGSGYPGTGGFHTRSAANNTGSATTGITVNSAGAGGSQNMPPSCIAGLRLIRAG